MTDNKGIYYCQWGKCKKEALPDKEYCKYHLRKKRVWAANRVIHRKLPMFYEKYLSKTLKESIEEQLHRDVNEQLNLFEELALMRSTVAEGLKLYSACIESGKPAMALEGARVLQEMLNEVRVMCQAAAGVEVARKDNISPLQLKTIVTQIVSVIYQELGDENEDLARKIEHRLSSDIRLPSDSRGTDLDPTSDVQAMIDSIPKLEE